MASTIDDIRAVTATLTQLQSHLLMRYLPLPESDSESETIKTPVRVYIKGYTAPRRIVSASPKAAVVTVARPKYSCIECNKLYKSAGALQYHNKAKHLHLYYYCPCCDYKSPQRSNVYQHMGTVHCKSWIPSFNESHGSCKFCSTVLKTGPGYYQHSIKCEHAQLDEEASKMREQMKTLKMNC